MRDLVVVGVDLVEGQEAVPVAAVFDEGRLQAGLYPGDLGEVDVAAKLLLGAALEVEIFNPGSVHDDHPRFFRVGGVDQHFLGHQIESPRRAADPRSGRRLQGRAHTPRAADREAAAMGTKSERRRRCPWLFSRSRSPDESAGRMRVDPG